MDKHVDECIAELLSLYESNKESSTWSVEDRWNLRNSDQLDYIEAKLSAEIDVSSTMIVTVAGNRLILSATDVTNIPIIALTTGVIVFSYLILITALTTGVIVFSYLLLKFY